MSRLAISLLLAAGSASALKWATPSLGSGGVSGEALEADAPTSQAIDARLAEVVARMDSAVAESQAALKEQAETYQREEHDREDALRLVEVANQGIAQKVTALRTQNANLRSRARALRENTSRMLEEMKTLKSNVSIAQDFVSDVLNKSSRLASQAVQVLVELRNGDAVAARKEERQKTLSELTSEPPATNAALMQLEDTTKPQRRQHRKAAPKANVSGVATKLLKTLESITDERDKSNATLVKQHKVALEQLSAAQAQALEEQTNLNASLKEQEELNRVLLVAVQHLEQTQTKLLKQRESFRQFANRLADRALPVAPPTVPEAAARMLVSKHAVQHRAAAKKAHGMKGHNSSAKRAHASAGKNSSASRTNTSARWQDSVRLASEH